MAKFQDADIISTLLVEKMGASNLSEILKIERTAYSHPWTQAMFLTSLSSSDDCWLLLSEGKILGYAVVSYVLDEAHLLNFCISPEVSGLGLGRFLLRYLVSKAMERGSKLFFLEVRVSNQHAINLYFSEGFNEVGIRPNYYPSDKGREDAVLMTLDLAVDFFV